MLQAWIRVTRRPILIWHRPGESAWADDAPAYWEGRLAGLQPVPASKTAIVHRRGSLYFKRYLIRNRGDVLKHLFFASRARRALLRGEELAAAGIHVPRPACLIEERRWGTVTGSALVTEAIDDAPNLRDWLNKPDLGVAGRHGAKRELLAAFAREVARWHNAGFHHADMRIGNILCRREAGGWTFHWLDNEGNSRHRVIPAQERVHNLMQVNMERTGVSLTDRMYFWKAYAAAAGIPAKEERTLQRAVMAYTQRRWKERGWLSSEVTGDR
jgi:hypothetical protein